MRIIVTGGTDFTDGVFVDNILLSLMAKYPDEHLTLVSGGALGLDELAEDLALDYGWQVEIHPADWRKYGKAAGPRRNEEMARSGADLLVAFPGGRGTADMVRRAQAHEIPVVLAEDVPGATCS